MAAEQEKTEGAATPAKQGKSLAEKLPQILTAAFLVVNLLVMFGGTFVIYKIKFLDKKEAMTDSSLAAEFDRDRALRDQTQVRFTFDPFVVNLDERQRKLVHATIQLEMLNEDGYVEVVEKTPVARDQIVKILNSKKYIDIETIQGKLFLKDQIQTAMNKMLQKGSVKDVYFSEFVVQ